MVKNLVVTKKFSLLRPWLFPSSPYSSPVFPSFRHGPRPGRTTLFVGLSYPGPVRLSRAEDGP